MKTSYLALICSVVCPVESQLPDCELATGNWTSTQLRVPDASSPIKALWQCGKKFKREMGLFDGKSFLNMTTSDLALICSTIWPVESKLPVCSAGCLLELCDKVGKIFPREMGLFDGKWCQNMKTSDLALICSVVCSDESQLPVRRPGCLLGGMWQCGEIFRREMGLFDGKYMLEHEN